MTIIPIDTPAVGTNPEQTQALHLYDLAQGSWLERMKSIFARSSRTLFKLDEIMKRCTVMATEPLGLQQVPISQIRGSANAGRAEDFDLNFRPLQKYNKERWLGVATAYRRGKQLPPVSLIQVEDVYFVDDGHHRISVVRAMGRTEIAAVVTTWQVAGALPWHEQAASRVGSSTKPVNKQV